MDLEKLLEAQVQKALAAALPQGGEIVKADEVAAKVLEAVKSELPALVKAAVVEESSREGVGSKKQLQEAAEPTLESDPVAYLAKKARSVKDIEDWSVEERGVISGIFVKHLAKGMLGNDDED
jgi:hypothetical protein